jgi:hypothetical protein
MPGFWSIIMRAFGAGRNSESDDKEKPVGRVIEATSENLEIKACDRDKSGVYTR